MGVGLRVGVDLRVGGEGGSCSQCPDKKSCANYTKTHAHTCCTLNTCCHHPPPPPLPVPSSSCVRVRQQLPSLHAHRVDEWGGPHGGAVAHRYHPPPRPARRITQCLDNPGRGSLWCGARGQSRGVRKGLEESFDVEQRVTWRGELVAADAPGRGRSVYMAGRRRLLPHHGAQSELSPLRHLPRWTPHFRGHPCLFPRRKRVVFCTHFGYCYCFPYFY